jgi:CO dehydrogenase/acetyl-CoA synthase delta subunit
VNLFIQRSLLVRYGSPLAAALIISAGLDSAPAQEPVFVELTALKVELAKTKDELDAARKDFQAKVQEMAGSISTLQQQRADSLNRIRSECIRKDGHGHVVIKFPSPMPSEPVIAFSIVHTGADPRPTGFIARKDRTEFVVRTDAIGEIGQHDICYIAISP